MWCMAHGAEMEFWPGIPRHSSNVLTCSVGVLMSMPSREDVSFFSDALVSTLLVSWNVFSLST